MCLLCSFYARWCHLACCKAPSLLCNANKTDVTIFLQNAHWSALFSFRTQWLLLFIASWATTFFNCPQISRSTRETKNIHRKNWAEMRVVASCAAARKKTSLHKTSTVSRSSNLQLLLLQGWTIRRSQINKQDSLSIKRKCTTEWETQFGASRRSVDCRWIKSYR